MARIRSISPLADVAVIVALSAGSFRVAASDAFDAVDPFWGSGATDNPLSEGMARGWNWEKAQTGNTHPGAMLPFGWVSACAYSGAYSSGYGMYGCSSDGPAPVLYRRKLAYGFSHFQHTGTGWISKFYNYFLFVPSGSDADVSKLSRLDDEVAQPGYYAGKLTDYGAAFELTVRPYAACHRYRFSSGTGMVRINADQIGLVHDAVCKIRPAYKEKVQSCELKQAGPRSWEGFASAHGVTIYCAIRASGEIESSECAEGRLLLKGCSSELETAIGFSLESVAQASSRADEAIADGFDRSRQKSRMAWDDILGRVQTGFSDRRMKCRFYSALYQSLLKPSNCGGSFVDFTTMWDVYRTELPLALAFGGNVGRGIVEHLMSEAERKRFASICQIMDNSVVHKDMQATALPLFTLCDGFFRGHLSAADYPRIKGVFERELSHADISGMSPTHALDLSGACGAAAFVAEACGDRPYAEGLRRRAGVWRDAYDPKTGLLWAQANYYEGNHFNYSFRPHPGMGERVSLIGGAERFCQHLDDFFCYGCPQGGWDPLHDRIGRPNHFEGLNNESDMDSPFAYYWCGRPDRTAEIVDLIRRCRFADGAGGCPGNNDSGGLSSWYVWACLGLYPLTGTPYYMLCTPLVDSAALRFGRGILTLEVKRESDRSIYPVGFSFNGKSFSEPWLKVADLESGGRLAFLLRDRPVVGSVAIPGWL